MFKLIYVSTTSTNLVFTSKEYEHFDNQGEIRHPQFWKKVLVICGFIKINL